MSSKYEFFWRSESPFSQFFSCQYILNQKEFNCAEQGMMYGKAVLFKDHEIAKKILECDDPTKMKKLGRIVKNFDQETWEQNRETIVYENNMAKFSQNPYLKEALFATGDRKLVEASPFDTIWGIGLGKDNPKAQSSKTWRGLNLLGKILTRVKHDLKKLEQQ